MLVRALTVCLTILITPFAMAQKASDTFSVNDLNKVEDERDKVLKRLEKLEQSGKQTDRELREIEEDLIRAAADSRRRETAAIESQLKLAELELREKDTRDRLLRDEETLEDILAILMTFGSRRPPALASHPDNVSAAIRSAILMGEIAPKLAEEAETLANELDILATLQANIHAERAELERAEKTLLARRQEIEALAAEKRNKRRELAKATIELEVQNASLAREANSLQTLLDSLAQKAPTRPSLKPAAPRKFNQLKKKSLPKQEINRSTRKLQNFAATSKIQRPVLGSLVESFGNIQISGSRALGQTWATRKGAQIISPRDAHVEYAGEFRTYGQMLILNLGDGYLVILAGMESIYAEVGQSILSGEPVGRMSDHSKSSPELYIEVRRNGTPVDPETLLGRNT